MDPITKPPPSVARSISPDGTIITTFSTTGKSRPQHLSMQSISSFTTFDSMKEELLSPASPTSTIAPSHSPSPSMTSFGSHHMSISSLDSSWTYDEDNEKTFCAIVDPEKGEIPPSVMARGPSIRPGSALPEFTGGYRAVVWKSFKDEKVIETSDPLPLPDKRQHRYLRHARHTFLNVYRRLFSLVFIFNMAGLSVLLSQNSRWTTNPPLEHFATAASANIMVALLIRQDYVVNTCFKVTWLVPLSTPLRLRRILAKVYEFGGVHSGAAVSSVIWFGLLSGFLAQQFAIGSLKDPGLMTFTYVLLALLLSLVITAYPRLRFMSHNTFENIHRWAGWFSLALFWAQLVLFSRTQLHPGSERLGIILIKLPAFWFLLISSLHAILPWLRFHKLPVTPEKLSNHAIRLHFTEPVPLFVGLRISDAPLKEWHSFACIPSRDGGKSGGSVLISDAGDWTRKTIANPKPYYYIKGIPVTGVLCMARIFRSIIIVTTGSGIGPCLGVMQDIPQTRCRVIWSTPNPMKTYGKDIVNAVKATDRQALIWDTRKRGRPDLVKMAWDMYVAERAECVFVISNPKLTRKVVYGMESRGVPAFGPIWDS